MNKGIKIILGLIGIVICTIMIVMCIKLAEILFTEQTSDNCYVITRTNDYPFTVEKISKTHKLLTYTQYVPIKGYSKIGLKYFCTIEMMDSTFIVNYTNKYLGNFNYEGLRYCTWELIESCIDSTFENTSAITDNYTYIKTRNLPDTIFYQGLKIYDIEPYSIDKYLEKIDILSETTKYENLNGNN